MKVNAQREKERLGEERKGIDRKGKEKGKKHRLGVETIESRGEERKDIEG